MTDPHRTELRGWLEDNAPRALWHTATRPFQGHWGGRNKDFESDDHAVWFERCLARGWTAPHWPRAYGGGGMTAAEHRIWQEELARIGVPQPLIGFGLTMIGPILLEEGDEAQKRLHLPRIARGEVRWSQGYSEPGAGSDLASLRTRAVRDGDALVIDGQKTWTSHADLADWMFCLVRTNPDVAKQAGISFVLIDLRTPGVTLRPILLISGASPFCEVFFEGVRVPLANVVGGIDQGWRVAKSLLGHERAMVGASVAAGGARLPVLSHYGLREHAVEAVGLAEGRLSDPTLRHEIAQSEMDEMALRLTLQRAEDAAQAGHRPGAETSLSKLAGTELNQRRWEIAMKIADLEGLGWEGPGFEERELALSRQWLRSRGNTIEGGTSEIQRNIIALRVLGLPK
jgi:acyl-CoA dehydrogenase